VVDDLPDIEGTGPAPEAGLDQRQLFDTLFQMTQSLPPRQAEIITMRFFSGMKNKEIATVLDIKETTVAASLCRGLNTLFEKSTANRQ
jgi:RNA polymerase sigma factor (sigma-70 family)